MPKVLPKLSPKYPSRMTPQPVRVSLDAYRSPGVRCFSGRDRGRAVGEHIRRVHGGRVEVEVPADVYHVAPGFWSEMIRALPDATYPALWVLEHNHAPLRFAFAR